MKQILHASPPSCVVPARMSFLSNTLDRLLREKGWTQTELERRTGIGQSQISRYLAGLLPTTELAGKLFAAFGPGAGAELLAAFLQDSAPPAQLPWVTITINEPIAHGDLTATNRILREDAPVDSIDLRRLPPRARTALLALAAACESRPQLIAAVENLLALAR